MELHEIHLPSVADYVAAFQATEARITPKQRELLLVHHRAQARVTSATRLAEAVGFENYNAVNLQYGSHPGIREDDVEGSALGLHRRVESVEVGQIGDRALHRAGIRP